jgi:NAD dependent epimerase/dehydratase family enzyme
MGGMLLASQRVAPKAAEAAGFTFRFPVLAGALADLLKG